MASKKRFAPTQSVCDASTLILLTKADLIDTVLKLKNLIIAEKVYEETVRRGKQKGLADAFKASLTSKVGSAIL